METFKTRSLSKDISDKELENLGSYSSSFLSFERAINQELEATGRFISEISGYKITEQGIVIIWK